MSDSTSQPSSRTAKSGKFALLSRAIKHSDFIFKFFPYRVENLLNISSVFTELKAFLPKVKKDSKLISGAFHSTKFSGLKFRVFHAKNGTEFSGYSDFPQF